MPWSVKSPWKKIETLIDYFDNCFKEINYVYDIYVLSMYYRFWCQLGHQVKKKTTKTKLKWALQSIVSLAFSFSEEGHAPFLMISLILIDLNGLWLALSKNLTACICENLFYWFKNPSPIYVKLAKLLLHGKQGEKRRMFTWKNHRQKCRCKGQKDYVSLATIVEKINISSKIHQSIFSATQ